MEKTNRRENGIKLLRDLNAAASDSIQENLKDIAPDMVNFLTDFAYGDIYARPGLDLKTRQIITISSLAALGNATPQLKFHMEAAVNIGLSPNEIIEIIYIVTVFSGFPAGLNAIFAAKEVFLEKGIQVKALEKLSGERRERGLKTLAATSKGSGESVMNALSDIATDMVDFLLDFSYGDVFARPYLSHKWKEFIMISAAAARGTMTPQLKVHIHAALNVGGTKEEIIELMYQIAVYAGFPAALNGIYAAKEVFETVS